MRAIASCPRCGTWPVTTETAGDALAAHYRTDSHLYLTSIRAAYVEATSYRQVAA